MRKGKDISVSIGDLYLVHQNLPGKKGADYKFGEHILFIPLQGEIAVVVEGEEFNLGLGQMLYLPPGTKHSFDSSVQTGERLIAMLAVPTQKIPAMRLPLNQFIKELLFHILLHPKAKSSKGLVQAFRETLFELLVDGAASDFEHIAGKSKDTRVQKALQYLGENATQALSMDDAARVAGLSLRNFNRLILKETGQTPKRWLIHLRMEKAKELLVLPKASVTEVALSVGYNSLSQFISAFRSHTGRLPSDFSRHG